MTDADRSRVGGTTHVVAGPVDTCRIPDTTWLLGTRPAGRRGRGRNAISTVL